MSAYFVEAALVDALLTHAHLKLDGMALRLTVPADCTNDGKPLELDFAKREHCTDVGKILLTANADSLAARYPNADDTADNYRAAEAYSFIPFAPMAPETMPARVILAAECFAYQACEFDGWNMSLAQWIVQRIQCRAGYELAKAKLPSETGSILTNPARGTPDSQCWSALAPAPESTPDGEAPSAPRAALLAKLNADPDAPAPAIADAPAPAAAKPGPKPEPETAAKAAAKGAKGRKARPGRKAPAKGAKRSTARKSSRKAQSRAKLERAGRMPEARKAHPKGGGTASPPAAAPKRKASSPIPA